ncbi:MarR family transcriptional regulator [Vibrio parahaemolyticus]|uniref:MarR family transcriptional regulator n=3 Tax=Vibrio parahaemolyticus TaxID=670 RepID=UPI0011203AB7|nr:MarR family transcriptional regulator [Vibrio parahaemolyticus]MDG2663738.1 MarR family transcriptional regulator [Vibrio parahaemolyticus]TOJ27235.1 hypothetical protein CGI41_23660 [Vibrio parahaemolyticus]TOJ90564.1 hypothetical protein CGI29_23365 [Vibrio parahaemolyticus]HCH3760298.1 MarR family transcriptional regulator [Vibrio parahaemolyticus]HCH5065567.1 MarR family transcriptional regulator [Vibrio parahaemolyticus]
MEQTKEVVIQTVQLSTISDVLAIILSVVALIVTVIGFFASLRFYQDGVVLQKSANDALTKLEEKTKNIQDQVTGMFDKTLNAAISKGVEIDNSFDALDQKVEDAKKSIIDEAINELGQAGIREREKIERIVNNQLSRLEDNISTTRELTENYINKNDRTYLASAKSMKTVMNYLVNSRVPLTMREIAESTQMPYTIVKRTVQNLVSQGVIDTVISEQDVARYRLSKEYAA